MSHSDTSFRVLDICSILLHVTFGTPVKIYFDKGWFSCLTERRWKCRFMLMNNQVK